MGVAGISDVADLKPRKTSDLLFRVNVVRPVFGRQ
jgi:hypothetical protein